jgi:heterodisulfide reductase subunit C
MFLRKPSAVLRKYVEGATHAGSPLCWTCSSCDLECPVNRATGRLRPQKILRLANLGLLEELIQLPEIWYCQICRRCSQICPNGVQPDKVIGFAREEALRLGVVVPGKIQQYYALFAAFQRVRWQAAAICQHADLEPVSDRQWHRWLENPVIESRPPIHSSDLFKGNAAFKTTVDKTGATICFTCGECSSGCPISGNRDVFDPRVIVRTAMLGLTGELLRSPSIWLCLDCRRCTEGCSQTVKGHQLIGELQQLAIEGDFVDAGIRWRLAQADKIIYPRLLDAVDSLLGLQDGQAVRPQALQADKRLAAEFLQHGRAHAVADAL